MGTIEWIKENIAFVTVMGLESKIYEVHINFLEKLYPSIPIGAIVHVKGDENYKWNQNSVSYCCVSLLLNSEITKARTNIKIKRHSLFTVRGLYWIYQASQY